MTKPELLELLRDVRETVAPLMVGYGPHRDVMRRIDKALEEG